MHRVVTLRTKVRVIGEDNLLAANLAFAASQLHHRTALTWNAQSSDDILRPVPGAT